MIYHIVFYSSLLNGINFIFTKIMLPILKSSKLWVNGNGVKRHFQQYFSYIVAVSFIGGRNRSTRRKPMTCHKSLTNFIT